jgi:phage terminase large subunit-like protein
MCKGTWNDAFVEEMASFREGCRRDDQVDAVSGAYNKLALGKPVEAPVFVPAAAPYDPVAEAYANEGMVWR